ncbi:MAG: type VI secretion system baseplate subunit TssE [Alphaproteobacteria bacterium]|nr:type VI secretion system baseplate subunit TssE [Alphaproteobacteria bacterium]
MRAIQSVSNEPKNTLGSKQLLFNLLIDEDPDEAWEDVSKNHLSFNEVIDSIISEISKILNTRLTAKFDDYEELKDDPLNYGIPSLYGLTDSNTFDATSPNQWIKISKLCERAIATFEPRMTDVKVTIEGFALSKQSLNIIVRGNVYFNKIREEVRFPLAIECGSGR